MSNTLRWTLGIAALVATARGAAEETQYYHLQRAVFRCSPMNRGLAVDAQHFWVGEFGGWIRCYDRQGQRQPASDLGGGTVKYLGHGVAACDGCVATGAWDVITVFPKGGGAAKNIKPAVSGNPCGVACDGRTLWAMNYQSPVLYEMDLDGRLLRQFKTAQQSSATSHDIAIDCDGHLYVLDGGGGGSQTLFEYQPDGKLLRTHRLAVKATAVAIDPKDKAKTLYTVSFADDPIVYEYRLGPGEPKEGPLPRLARQRRYRPDGPDIVIENGGNRFNRPLYGSNTAFFIYAGDLPEILMSLPGKGGVLWLGLRAGEATKWLSDAERIVTRYRAGAMQYEIADALLGPGSLAIDVIPRPEGEGVLVRVTPSANARPAELIWAFGGATGYTAWSLDTCGYCPESTFWLKPEDCEKHEFKILPTGFELRSPGYKDRVLVGTVPPDSSLKVADADKLGSPKTLLASQGGTRNMIVGRRAMRPGEPLYLALDRLAPPAAAPKPADLPEGLKAAETRRKAVADRVRVSTPDPYMNAAVPAICSAADGIWDPPVYVHGGVAWHMPYLGWRGAYAASDFGWPDRAKTHFRTFAAVQLKEPATGKPKADPESNLARPAADSVIYTRGYIPVHPTKDARGPYDMQQVYIDQLLWHFLWSGDLQFVREMWPTLVAHLEWEKRCFDPDDDGLYENVANTFISDAHHYSGSPCTQASAYNYRSLLMAARLAKLIGEKPEPFEREAKKTLAAMNRVLWMADRGWYAEYRDLLGLKQLHPSAELPSVYHPIDSFVPDPFQAWQMLRYVDTAIEHIPIEGSAVMLWSSNWVPFIWSVRDVCGVEVAHTALAYWQAGRPQKAYDLWRGAIIDSMFCCRAPGACIGTSELDGHMTGLCTDFADTVGMYARTLVEGLFGIVPDAIEGELLIRPGFPKDWPSASLDTPDVGYTYSRQGQNESFEVRAKFHRPMRLRLQLAARAVDAEVIVNGQKAAWKRIESVGQPMVEIQAPNANGAKVAIRWAGAEPARMQCPAVVATGETFTIAAPPAQIREIRDPQKSLQNFIPGSSSFQAIAAKSLGHRTAFARVEQAGHGWWLPIEFEVRPPLEICDTSADRQQGTVRFSVRNNTGEAFAGDASVLHGRKSDRVPLRIAPHATSSVVRIPAQGLVPGTNPISLLVGKDRLVKGAVVDWGKADLSSQRVECLDLSKQFNDRVSEIFKHEYREPRSPYCSMQIPLHGYGDWCYCGKQVPKIDDSALRAAAGSAGRMVSPQGIPFATPGPGAAPNVVFTSLWKNFPPKMTIPLSGNARHAWFLVAGSTHPMHSQFDNGEIVVEYTNGMHERLPLTNPTTWWPIEGDYQLAIDGFCIPGPHPPRIDLGSGRATILDLPLKSEQPLRSLTIRCLANDVVVGLMSVTLLRE